MPYVKHSIRDIDLEIESSINPYKAMRTNLGMTQAALSVECEVTSQVVTNAESGLYQKPPISVTSTLSELCLKRGRKISVEELESLYMDWVLNERSRNQHYFNHQFINTSGTWRDYRYSVNPSFRGFCRNLVFQPSILQEFERFNRNKPLLTQAMWEVLGGNLTLATKLVNLPKRGSIKVTGPKDVKEYTVQDSDRA